jgi:cell fate regulator YaaT (PSP1 superfamily)
MKELKPMSENRDEESVENLESEEQQEFYRIRFREDGQMFTASSAIASMVRGEVVMVKTDHSLEPATIVGPAPLCGCRADGQKATCEIARQANGEELERYYALPPLEERGYEICQALIDRHKLEMQLVRVERFFNGSKIIFYFTADNRVDFRELVKDLVQEFRTRVEMRQVGVRHETKMIGGMGTCGRELCCSSFIKKFDSVSIKMAKEQDLPLNPSKISGLCNRLLCCLTYEYDTYRQQRKGMPKPGRKIQLGDRCCKVKRQNPLQQSIVVQMDNGEEKLLQSSEWQACEVVRVDKGVKKEKKSKE